MAGLKLNRRFCKATLVSELCGKAACHLPPNHSDACTGLTSDGWIITRPRANPDTKADTIARVKLVLLDESVIRATEPLPHRKPTHGNCCTCQECGHGHDECVCDTNAILAALDRV